jgi:hypothetical protein
MRKPKKKFSKQPTSKFKSKLEEDFNDFLIQNKIKFGYENYKISYLKPEKLSKYTPDFNCPALDTFKIMFETKGQFLTSDRKKHLLIKEQHPNLDIRFVFSNSKTKIGKKSKTTYGKWCDLKGFKYHCVYSTKKLLPDEWVKEVKQQQKKL